jgi:hypothetical protein
MRRWLPGGSQLLSPRLNRDGTKAAKAFVGIFFATLFLYVTFYGACAAARRKGGPWVVTQDRLADGTPVLRIEHHKIIGLSNVVSITFPGERAPERFTNAPLQRIYTLPSTNALPFGPVEFVDVTFLPGTIALDAFGHLVEMVQRTLYLDGHEIPWTPGTNIVANPDTKLAADRRPQRKAR